MRSQALGRSNAMKLFVRGCLLVLPFLILSSCTLPAFNADLYAAASAKTVSGLTLSMTSLTITTIGGSVQLNVVVSPSDASNKNVSWSSSNTGVATVVNGLVTAAGTGTATITARTQDKGYAATCAVTVSTIAVTGITLNTSALSYLLGGSPQQLSVASFAPSGASDTVTWSSNDTNLATVDSTGLVTAGAGAAATLTVTITATAAHFPAVSATCVVTFTNAVVHPTGVTVAPPSATVGVGQTTPLAATIVPANATNINVTWTSDNTGVATVSSSGVVTGVSAGSATITATTVDGGFTSSSAITVVVHVTGVGLNKATLTLAPGAVDSTLVATVTPANATNQGVTWASSNPAVMTVSATGSITVSGSASLGSSATITVTTNDGAFTASCLVTVDVIVTSIVLNQSTLGLLAGETYALIATVTPSNGVVQWSSTTPGVATVSTTGVVTAVAGGTTTVIASDNTSTVTASCTVTVTLPAAVVAATPISSGTTGYIGATMALDPVAGLPVVAYQDGAGLGQVQKWVGAGSWTSIPVPFNTATFAVDSGMSHNISLVVDSTGAPVVAYIDTTLATANVNIWNGLLWTSLTAGGTSTTSPLYLALAVSPYVSILGNFPVGPVEFLASVNSVLSPNAASLEVFDPHQGSAWVLPTTGTLQYDSPATWMAIAANPLADLTGTKSSVFVASVINSTTLRVDGFGEINGQRATQTVPANSSFVSTAADGLGVFWVAYKDGSTGSLVLTQGPSLTTVATIPGPADYISLAIDTRTGRNVVYMSFKDGANGGVASIWKYQNGTASVVVTDASGGAAVSGTKLVMNSSTGRLYLLYEAGGIVTVKEIDR